MVRNRFGLRVLAAAWLACAASGCFLDEIDKSVNADKVKAQAVAPGAPAAGANPKQVAAATPGKPAAPKGPSWWQTAHSLGSEESKSDIVPCKRASGVEFMDRDDCLARGGATQ